MLFLHAVHVHKKFLSRKGVKFRAAEEEHQWAKALKAMNAHIRYRRAKLVAASKDSQLCGSQVKEDELSCIYYCFLHCGVCSTE